jgi:hypothetical protein
MTTGLLLIAVAIALAWPWIKAHAPTVDLAKLDRHHYAALALGVAALVSLANRSTGKPEPAPAPPQPTTLDLRGTFVGPDAAADAATTAALCHELAAEIEWDATQPNPLITTGVAFDELRTRSRLLLCRGVSLGEKHPRARAAIEAYLNANAGTSGGPLTPEAKAKWVSAYREVGEAAEAAVR